MFEIVRKLEEFTKDDEGKRSLFVKGGGCIDP